MCERLGGGPREHVRPMIVHAEPSPPETEERLMMSADAREVGRVFERVRL